MCPTARETTPEGRTGAAPLPPPPLSAVRGYRNKALQGAVARQFSPALWRVDAYWILFPNCRHLVSQAT